MSKLSRRLLVTSEGAGGVDDACGGVEVAVVVAAVAVVVAAISAGGVCVEYTGSGRAIVPRRLGPWAKKNGGAKGSRMCCGVAQRNCSAGRACPPARPLVGARRAPPWVMRKKEGVTRSQAPSGDTRVTVVGLCR